MKTLSVGLIGAGVWGNNHAWIYSNLPFVKLVAVSDLSKERARATADKYGIPNVYTDYRELLRRPEIEAVSVVTPDYLHREPAIATAEAGKHILLEKPLATTVADGEAIVNAARKAGVALMVNFHNRWNPPFALAKEAVEKGELGSILFVSSEIHNTLDIPTEMLSWPTHTSVLFFLGSHVIDLLQWLLDDQANKAYAASRSAVLTKLGLSVPDFYQAILEFSRGVTATVEASWVLPKGSPILCETRMRLTGTDGSINIDPFTNRCIEKQTKTGHSYPEFLVLPSIHGKPVGSSRESISYFVDCILNKKQPMPTGENALAVTKTICAMIESANLRRPVSVE